MGEIRQPPRALFFVAGFSADESLLDRVPKILGDAFPLFANIPLQSERFGFDETRYYEPTMGGPLWKRLFAAGSLAPADLLPQIKTRTNALEADAAGAVPRPLNLDPGYVDLGKVVLASTKDHAHRLYLADGIFGEVTLYNRQKRWEPWPWTYPDYRRAEVTRFFDAARELYRQWAD